MSRIEDYRIIYYYSIDDGCYLATIPDLAGCISDGETVKEAIKNVRNLAKDWIEIAEEDGDVVPCPTFQDAPIGGEVGIFDVAVYMLTQTGTITTKALQKLLYYCKAWSCGWFGKALFPEPFEAWSGGPMNRALYNRHSGLRMAKAELFISDKKNELSDEQKSFVQEILSVYQEIAPDRLGEMTHKEDPWKEARGNLPEGARSENEIPENALMKYYGQAAVA